MELYNELVRNANGAIHFETVVENAGPETLKVGDIVIIQGFVRRFTAFAMQFCAILGGRDANKEYVDNIQAAITMMENKVTFVRNRVRCGQ